MLAHGAAREVCFTPQARALLRYVFPLLRWAGMVVGGGSAKQRRAFIKTAAAQSRRRSASCTRQPRPAVRRHHRPVAPARFKRKTGRLLRRETLQNDVGALPAAQPTLLFPRGMGIERKQTTMMVINHRGRRRDRSPLVTACAAGAKEPNQLLLGSHMAKKPCPRRHRERNRQQARMDRGTEYEMRKDIHASRRCRVEVPATRDTCEGDTRAGAARWRKLLPRERTGEVLCSRVAEERRARMVC